MNSEKPHNSEKEFKEITQKFDTFRSALRLQTTPAGLPLRKLILRSKKWGEIGEEVVNEFGELEKMRLSEIQDRCRLILSDPDVSDDLFYLADQLLKYIRNPD